MSAKKRSRSQAELLRTNARLGARLHEAEETLRAIRGGEVDAVVVGDQVYSLSSAETPYRILVEAMNEGAAGLTEDGILLYNNARLAELLRMPASSLVGSSIRGFVASADLPVFDALLAQAKEGASTGEIRIQRQGASEVSVQVSLSRLDAPGLPGIALVVVDLTRRKRMEHELSERVKELQAFYRLGTFVEREGITLDELYEEFTGILPQSWQYPEITCARLTIGDREFHTANFADSPWKQSAPVNVHGVTAGKIEVGYLEERPEEHEGPFLREERQLVDALAEQIGHIIGRKQAEEEVKRNLLRLQALREIDAAILSTLDLQTVLGTVLEKADAFFPIESVCTLQLLDRDSETLAYTACRNINMEDWKIQPRLDWHVHPKVVIEDRLPLIVRNLQTHPRTRQYAFYQWNHLVSYLGVPLVVHDKILGVLSLYTRKEHEFSDNEVGFLFTLAGQAAIAIHNAQLYEQMVMANKVKDEFLGVMSHELRTPLNVVTGYTGMMLDGLLGEINDKQRDALERVMLRANEQLVMINNILFATVVETQRIHVDNQPVALGDLMHQIRSGYEFPLNKQFTLNWECPSPQAVIHTDSAKLKQILHNLINNSIKFTGKGAITIRARKVQAGIRPGRTSDRTPSGMPRVDSVEFKVVDTGVGIPREHIPFIFDKFHQGDSSEIRAFGGVGIGLYLVKKFTDLLGGSVEVESEVGKGSTFTVTIPSAGTEP